MVKIGALINFCSNEYPFLSHCLSHLKPICSQIIVSVCDHYYNGKKEDLSTLKKIYSEFPNVTFIQYPYLGNTISKKAKKKKGGRVFDGISRTIGASFLDEDTDYVLFMDADEIIDTERFLDFIKTESLEGLQAAKFSNYWYFREPKYRSQTFEDSILLAKKSALSKKVLFGKDDRDGIFQRIKGNKKREMTFNNKPLFHHYSWVRTKDQMLRKVLSWGHRSERDWAFLVEEEFSRDFNGKDFVHGYSFDVVEPYIEIDLLKKPTKKPKDILNNLLSISEKKALKTISIPMLLRSYLPFTKTS